MQSSVHQQQQPELECLTPLLACIVKEFEGVVKQFWVFAQHSPEADFSQLEEQARQLSRDCFASALLLYKQQRNCIALR